MTTLELDTIWTLHMNGPGFIRSHTRPFGVLDVFSDVKESSMINLKTLVEINLEVILVGNASARGDDRQAVKNEFHNDPVVGEISVVKND